MAYGEGAPPRSETVRQYVRDMIFIAYRSRTRVAVKSRTRVGAGSGAALVTGHFATRRDGRALLFSSVNSCRPYGVSSACVPLFPARFKIPLGPRVARRESSRTGRPRGDIGVHHNALVIDVLVVVVVAPRSRVPPCRRPRCIHN